MGVADDVVTEHQRIADTLSQVGPDAPAGVGDWTAADLGAHLLSQMAGGGVVTFLGRSLVARGVRLNDRAGAVTERAIRFYGRRGFERAVDAVRRGPPRLLLRQSVAPVTLFEVWVHHDDVRRANGLPPPGEPASLGRAVDFARRYQRGSLTGTEGEPTLSDADLLRWLAGRPSPAPPPDPPLRF